MLKYKVTSDFTEYSKLFLEENSKLNLISKNDEQYLFEKHIYDSLSIKLFLDKYKIENPNILDIGCGGGFPCVPIAIEFPNIKITGLDSIRKKINSVNTIKEKLELNNLDLVCDRVENLKNKKYDIVLSRAVGDMGKISSYALPLVKKGGYFIAYKSKKTLEELKIAEKTIQSLGGKVVDIIPYILPTKDIFERNLICVQKLK